MARLSVRVMAAQSCVKGKGFHFNKDKNSWEENSCVWKLHPKNAFISNCRRADTETSMMGKIGQAINYGVNATKQAFSNPFGSKPRFNLKFGGGAKKEQAQEPAPAAVKEKPAPGAAAGAHGDAAGSQKSSCSNDDESFADNAAQCASLKSKPFTTVRAMHRFAMG